jgi:hypothetical protein
VFTPVGVAQFLFDILQGGHKRFNELHVRTDGLHYDRPDFWLSILDPSIGSGRLTDPWRKPGKIIIGYDVENQGADCDLFIQGRFENQAHFPMPPFGRPDLVQCNPLCCPQHNGFSVAQVVMWRPARFLRDFLGLCRAGHHIIFASQGSQKLHESWILTPRFLSFAVFDLALHKGLGLHLQINLGIYVGRAQAHVAQPGSNRVDVHASAKEVGCGRVTDRVGSHTFLRHGRQLCCHLSRIA